MLITASPSQMQMDLESNSLLNIANASSDGDSGGDDKDDDKDDEKDDDKDKDDEKDDDKDKDDEKDEDDEKEENNGDSNDDNNNDSNDDSNNDETSEESTEEKTEAQRTDASDTTTSSSESEVEETTTESSKNDVSEIATLSAETPESTNSLEPTISQAAPTTDTPSLAAVTDQEQTQNTATGGITTNQETTSDPTINEAKAQEVSNKIVENLIQDEADKIVENLIQDEELTEGLPDHIKNILFDPEINEAKAQEVSNKIVENLIQDEELTEGLPDHIKNILSGQNEQLTTIIEEEGLVVYESIQQKRIAEQLMKKDPNMKTLEAFILSGIIIEGIKHTAGNKWNQIVDIQIENIDAKDQVTMIGTEVLVNKSSSKSDKNNERDDNDDRCDTSYPSTCIPPPPPNLKCGDSKVPNNLKVKSPDPHGFDHDKDGTGCESNNNNNNNNIKKIIKYQGSKCTTQSGSIPLAGKIPPKTPILIGDFYPCKLDDGRATLNLLNTPNLQFALIHLDKKDGNHEAVVVNPQKIQNVGQNSALFVVKFNDQFQGQDPITGQSKTIKDVNAIALYNKSKQILDFKDGNGLGITAVLKS